MLRISHASQSLLAEPRLQEDWNHHHVVHLSTLSTRHGGAKSVGLCNLAWRFAQVQVHTDVRQAATEYHQCGREEQAAPVAAAVNEEANGEGRDFEPTGSAAGSHW